MHIPDVGLCFLHFPSDWRNLNCKVLGTKAAITCISEPKHFFWGLEGTWANRVSGDLLTSLEPYPSLSLWSPHLRGGSGSQEIWGPVWDLCRGETEAWRGRAPPMTGWVEARPWEPLVLVLMTPPRFLMPWDPHLHIWSLPSVQVNTGVGVPWEECPPFSPDQHPPNKPPPCLWCLGF